MQIHDHGIVDLIDFMPATGSWDDSIVQAAAVSYGKDKVEKTLQQKIDLIRYMERNNHTSPKEMVETKWYVKMPIFVARQWIRHRTASVNEYSARYSVVKDSFFRPIEIPFQSTTNKQGRSAAVDLLTAEEFEQYLDKAEGLYQDYEHLVDKGVSREIARIGLPLSSYTEMYWKIDLHNLFHFLKLRMDPHAQQEIRDYAIAMADLIKPHCPIAFAAFMDYKVNAISLSATDQKCIQDFTFPENNRELDELIYKVSRLNMPEFSIFLQNEQLKRKQSNLK